MVESVIGSCLVVEVVGLVGRRLNSRGVEFEFELELELELELDFDRFLSSVLLWYPWLDAEDGAFDVNLRNIPCYTRTTEC